MPLLYNKIRGHAITIPETSQDWARLHLWASLQGKSHTFGRWKQSQGL